MSSIWKEGIEGYDDGKLDDPRLHGIFDGSGALIDCTEDGDGGFYVNSRVLFTPEETGTYYVSAGAEMKNAARWPNEIGTYTLSVSIDSDDYSANACTNGVVTVEGSVEGAVEAEEDRDWYAIRLEQGKVYQIDLKGSSTGHGTLADPHIFGVKDGTEILKSYVASLGSWGVDDAGVGRNSRMIFTASRSGVHFISVGATGFVTEAEGEHAVKGTYELSVTEKLDDHVGDSGTTGELLVGGMVTGDIETIGDLDWFELVLKAGRTYEFVLKGSWDAHGTLEDPYISGIFDHEGTAIAGTSNEDTTYGPDSRVEFTADRNGTYYVSVGAEGSGTGTYKLWLEEYVG